jgi:lipopolysaccharide/colanic/teichoic acid biosynthesis glycosyltransferase
VNRNLDSFYNKHAKRWCDAVAGAALLTATSPVLLACAVAIKLDDSGPVFFHQLRAGKRGQPFTVHKLRTMTVGTDQIDGGYPTPTMVTRVGRWVRRLSLDEIPQLWNITIGEMSFVGPRPTLPDQVARYTERQFRRLDARPGLTGLAQIRFRNAAPWSVRIEADLEYVENISLSTDLRVLLGTIPAVLFANGQSIGETAATIDDLGPGSEPDTA